MRAYSADSEEALRARGLLKDWAGEGLLSEAQYRGMEQETVCELRRTNVFLRLVLFLFTLIIVGAAVALCFVVFLDHSGRQAGGVFMLIVAAICYVGAELAVSQARLYRYGIEEALAVCSAGFLCAGMQAAFFSGGPDTMECVVPIAGVGVSLWVWHRFGLPYAWVGAMVCVVWWASEWTASHAGQHAMVAGIYAAGLVVVGVVRPRDRFTYRNGEYSIAEALLWLGIYLAINLQLSPGGMLWQMWGGPRSMAEFGRPFYWATWALTWCLPPVVLARGLRGKDRFVIAVGAIAGVLTLVTNKPYLDWPRHTWDPMLLGALLTGVALFVRRWLAKGAGGVRRGFTAQRLSGKDKAWMSAGAAAVGLVSPHPIARTGTSEVRFGGGDSGGGGASSDY